MGWSNLGRKTSRWGGRDNWICGGKAHSQSLVPSNSSAPNLPICFYFEKHYGNTPDKIGEFSPEEESHGKRHVHDVSAVRAAPCLVFPSANGGKHGKATAANDVNAAHCQLVVSTQHGARPRSRTRSPSHYSIGSVTTADKATSQKPECVARSDVVLSGRKAGEISARTRNAQSDHDDVGKVSQGAMAHCKPLSMDLASVALAETRGMRLRCPNQNAGEGDDRVLAKGTSKPSNHLLPTPWTGVSRSSTTSPSHYYTVGNPPTDESPSPSKRSSSASHYFKQVDKTPQDVFVEEQAGAWKSKMISRRPTVAGPLRGLAKTAPTPSKERSREARATTPSWRPPQADSDDELADPDVVFTCCDTHKSGLLHPHELKFALNAYGLFPDADTVKEWMHGTSAFNRAEFRTLLEAKWASVPQSMRQPRAIPYARRGISLGQLDALHQVFVRSGWIEARCEQSNKENEVEIAEGKVYRLEANLYALDKFVVRPLTSPHAEANKSVPEKMRQAACVPKAAHRCSYSELVNPNGVRVDTFVSHYWGHPFEDTMQALGKWGQQVYKSYGREHPEDLVFWLCFLALNQHRAAEEVGSSPEEGPFNAALAQARNAIMILDDSVSPFKRIWCLYEVQRLTDLSKDFELVSSCGPMGASLSQNSHSMIRHYYAVESMRRIGDALEQVSAYNAGASNRDDKHAIWHRVADPVVRQIPLVKILGQRPFRESDFKRFDMKIRSLLAGPLFRTSLSSRDCKEAVRYIALGAAFSEQDVGLLMELCDEDALEMEMPVRRGHDKPVMWKLLHAAAYFGHKSAVIGLLDRQADMEVQTRFGLTPLHLATSNDNSEVARLLLAREADVNALNKDKRSALHGAAIQGHLGCVEVLLQHRADVSAADGRGDSVLHAAVHGNNGEVVRILLESHANPWSVTRRGGLTPLHCAARDNFAEAADALLKFGPLRLALAKSGGGLTAWELADKEGYAELARKLWKVLPVDKGTVAFGQ